MTMPARRGGSDNLTLLLSALGTVQFLAAGLVVVFGFQEAETPILFGLSIGRIALATVAFAVAAILLVEGILLYRRRSSILDLLNAIPARVRRWFPAAGVVAAGVCWISIFGPAHVFGDGAGYFSRLRPLLIAAGLLACELWIASGARLPAGTYWSRLHDLPGQFPRLPGLIFLVLLASWLVMLITKFGISKIGPYWNPPGVPLTGMQGIGVMILVCLVVLLPASALPVPSLQTQRRYLWLLPVLLYTSALVVWGLSPMERHYFSLRPAPPSFQPFPFSDARIYDLGALSILDGQGVFFHGFTDKPLYMVFLAILHALGGSNYVLLIWLQLAVLALIPVALYFLGRSFGGAVLGATVGLMTILQQRNSILAARQIDSVNAKLLMTEVPTVLFMALIAYLAFRWFSAREARYGLASGAIVGAAALIRVNPVFLLPVVGLFAIIALRPVRRLIIRHLLIFLAGFFLVFSPWLVTGVNESGIPWFWVKLQFVIEQRFQSQVLPTGLADTPLPAPAAASGSKAGSGVQAVAYFSPVDAAGVPPLINAAGHAGKAVASGGPPALAVPAVLQRAASHSLHNATSALLSLPNIFDLDTLDQLGEVTPWGNTTWQGDLSPSQHVAVVMNLVLLALGLAWSWRKLKWRGMVPLLVFLGYDLSLAVATTSGGRYIVPVNWVAHFYWALGWVAVVQAFAHDRLPAPSNDETGPAPPQNMQLQGMWPWVAIAVFLGAWIPVANVLLPTFVRPHLDADARAALSAVSPHTAPGERVVYGEVLYPYDHAKSRSVLFNLLTDSGYEADLVVPRDAVLPYAALRSGALGAAVLSSDSQLRAAQSLYVAAAR